MATFLLANHMQRKLLHFSWILQNTLNFSYVYIYCFLTTLHSKQKCYPYILVICETSIFSFKNFIIHGKTCSVHITWFALVHISNIYTIQLRCNFTFAREQFFALSSNLHAFVYSYLWHVLYYLWGAHVSLLNDLQDWFMTWLCMLVSSIMA